MMHERGLEPLPNSITGMLENVPGVNLGSVEKAFDSYFVKEASRIQLLSFWAAGPAQMLFVLPTFFALRIKGLLPDSALRPMLIATLVNTGVQALFISHPDGMARKRATRKIENDLKALLRVESDKITS